MKASYNQKQSSIFPPPLPSQVKYSKKKEYVSQNGTIIKSTLDTGIKKKKIKSLTITPILPTAISSSSTSTSAASTPAADSSSSSSQPKKKKELSSPIISTQYSTNRKRLNNSYQHKNYENNAESLHDGPSPAHNHHHPLHPLPLHQQSLALSPKKRPFSLPLIEKKLPLLSITEMEPLRSSTGEKRLQPHHHQHQNQQGPSHSNSLTSLTLEIDLITGDDENITKKEKRQWREFKILTEDYHPPSSSAISGSVSPSASSSHNRHEASHHSSGHPLLDHNGGGGGNGVGGGGKAGRGGIGSGGGRGGGSGGHDHPNMSNELDLVRLNPIGKGSSASVYKSVLFPSLQVVADKVVVLSNKDKTSQIVRELKSLKAALQSDEACDTIVKLLDVYPNPRDGTLSMCLEYMNGGSLQEIVRSGGCQNEAILAGLSHMMLTGIAHLHNKRQLHRDIKPGNILLNCHEERVLLSGQRYYSGRVKISDFGLSKELEKGHSLADSFLGTFHYMSPERISGGDYSFPSDIWSFGMTILAVALGRYPFVTPNSAKSLSHSGEVITEGDGGYWAILQAIQERPSIRSLLSSCQHHCNHHSHTPVGFLDETSPTAHAHAIPPHFSKAFHSFLSQCLQKDPKQRPTAQALLQHAFFQKYPVNTLLCPSSASVSTSASLTSPTPSSSTAAAAPTAATPSVTLTSAAHLTDDFIRHCCVKHKENMEAKAISARNRMSRNDLFSQFRVVEDPAGSRSGEKTADNNATRRKIRQNSIPTDPNLQTSSNQDEGIKQLRTVVKAYREYVNRTWGRRIIQHRNGGSGGVNDSNHSSSSSSIEQMILTTLAPLHSKSVLFTISDTLNVPISVVKKTFQRIIRELKEHLTASLALSGGGGGGGGGGDGTNSTTLATLTGLFEKGFTAETTSAFPTTIATTVDRKIVTTEGQGGSERPGIGSSINGNTKSTEKLRKSGDKFLMPSLLEDRDPDPCPGPGLGLGPSLGLEGPDKLDRSDGSEKEAIAELRALMNTRSGCAEAIGMFDLSQINGGEGEGEGGEEGVSPGRPLPADIAEVLSGRSFLDHDPMTTQEIHSYGEDLDEILPFYGGMAINQSPKYPLDEEREAPAAAEEEEEEHDYGYEDDFEDDNC